MHAEVGGSRTHEIGVGFRLTQCGSVDSDIESKLSRQVASASSG
jgi:hypothetical protein